MSGRLAGKRAVVTGAANGIGRAVAERFAAEGARLVLLDVEAGALAALVEALQERGADAAAVVVDVRDEAQVADAFAQVQARLGGLDALVSNAAIEPPDDAPVDRLELVTWRRIVDTNLTGMFLVCKHGVRGMLQSGGSLVCTASPTGLFGLAPTEHAYSASKAGVHGLVRAMAAHYAPRGIRVNAVLPGFTATRVNRAVLDDPEALAELLRGVPAGRPGTPEEVAAMVLFLASDEATYAVGGVFAVDGGITAV